MPAYFGFLHVLCNYCKRQNDLKNGTVASTGRIVRRARELCPLSSSLSGGRDKNGVHKLNGIGFGAEQGPGFKITMLN